MAQRSWPKPRLPLKSTCALQCAGRELLCWGLLGLAVVGMASVLTFGTGGAGDGARFYLRRRNIDDRGEITARASGAREFALESRQRVAPLRLCDGCCQRAGDQQHYAGSQGLSCSHT